MAKKLSSFEEAFKEARAEGKKTFTFDGKKIRHSHCGR